MEPPHFQSSTAPRSSRPRPLNVGGKELRYDFASRGRQGSVGGNNLTHRPREIVRCVARGQRRGNQDAPPAEGQEQSSESRSLQVELGK